MKKTFEVIKIQSVEAREDHTLLLTFENGEKRVFDFREELQDTIFKPLENIALFMQARNRRVGVVWNDDIDIASEHLYYNGVPVV